MLNQDFNDLLSEFNAHGVEYIVVGAHALVWIVVLLPMTLKSPSKSTAFSLTGNESLDFASVGSGFRARTGESVSGEFTLENSAVYKHTGRGSLSNDWGVVTYEEGRVTSVAFLPD